MIDRLARRSTVPALCFGLLVACGPVERSALDDRELDDLATRYAAAWSGQDAAALASFYAEDGVLVVNGGAPSIGRAAVEATAASFMSAFPDMRVKLVELERSGEKVIFHWRWTGTNSGPGGTGNAVDITGREEWTLDADGSITESLGHYDEAEYQRQMNVTRDP